MTIPFCVNLPVDHPKHTEVLGERCSTRHGKRLWGKLDWKNWWIDGPEPHIFNAGGSYFHVSTKHGCGGVVFRVRCFYAGGTYRGQRVTSVGIGMVKGKLNWILRSEGKP